MTQTKKENPIVPLIRKQNHAISEALRGSPVTVEAFETSLRASVASNPDLATCVQQNPESVMLAIMQAAQLGLRPGPVHKHFALIPRRMGQMGWTCKGQLEYRGLINLAMRSEEIDDVDARVVYRGEQFEYDPITKKINHPWSLEDDVQRSPEDMVAVYAWAVVKGRDKPVVRVLRKADVEKRRNSSDAWKAYQAKKIKSTPWAEHPEPMWRKTALRALLESGLVPLGDFVRSAIQESAEDEEVFVDTEAVVRPDTESLISAALEACGGLPPTREETEEDLARLEEANELTKAQVAEYAERTYGEHINELHPALLWQVARDVEAGKVTA